MRGNKNVGFSYNERRGEPYYVTKSYNNNAVLHFGVIAKHFMLWRKVIASKTHHSGHKGAIIAIYS
jgi:hypothetical protein